MKTLIAYYSRSGVTKKAAERLKYLADGDLFEIKGEKNYGGYLRAVAVCIKELMTGESPAVTTYADDFASYDRILIGFPIWCGSCPKLILTFAGEYDFTGKDVYVFCTSGSTGPEKSLAAVAEVCAGANIHSALRIDGQSDNQIRAWLKK